MSNVYPKKEMQLLKREQGLKHALQSGSSLEKVKAAAENVKLAQLSFFKAQLYRSREARFMKEEDGRNCWEIEAQIENWSRMSVNDVLALFTN